jgi:carbonic anhydrase
MSGPAGIDHLFENNRQWAADILRHDPEFFRRLSRQQAPEYLWIGCSDSRVPANQIVGLAPGELFVHRNIANLVLHADLNCLSVLQFAIDVLKVRHIIVCGHYGCSGVHAALRRERIGVTDNWLREIQDTRDKHQALIAKRGSATAAADLLCELNVIEQVVNVSQTTVTLDAWARGQQLAIHGWIYGINNGLLRDLKVTVQRDYETQTAYSHALAQLGG